MDLQERTIESKEIYNGKVLRLRVDRVRLPDGNETSREIVEHRGAVAIVAVDEKNRVYFVRQYRKPLEKALLEIPAGKLEEGEEPLECAKRELAEEIGYTPGDIRRLTFVYTSPGYCNERVFIYLARDLQRYQLEKDEGEFLEVETYPLEEAVRMVLDGVIEDGKSITGILLASRYLSR